MPVLTAAIDPVTRIEGHLKVEVKVETVRGVQQVVDAFATGTLFRGFEKILEQRDPRDATILTSRICGVCPTSHAMASVLVLDQVCGVGGDTPARTASRLLRNLVHGACYLESHILHFYFLSLPDYVSALPVAPWLPGWRAGNRLDSATASRLRDHFRTAIAMRRNAHEMGAIFGGRLPHTPAFIPGGFTAVASAEQRDLFSAYLEELIQFIGNVYIPDVELVASVFEEYLLLGRGYGNLLAFGAFELDNSESPALLFRRGRRRNGSTEVEPLDLSQITEQVRYSWYADSDDDLNPAVGETRPENPKGKAYSWLKAPRYGGVPYECGPLARMTVNGDYRGGVSVMDRHRARAQEALKLALAMREWLSELPLNTGAYTPCTVPVQGTAVGLTEAPRGALGHWLAVQDRKIARYQVITPTCWTISPRDSQGQRGPLEEALIGIPVDNIDQPIEVLRVIHSVDPCLDCATHVIRAEADRKVFTLGPTICK